MLQARFYKLGLLSRPKRNMLFFRYGMLPCWIQVQWQQQMLAR